MNKIVSNSYRFIFGSVVIIILIITGYVFINRSSIPKTAITSVKSIDFDPTLPQEQLNANSFFKEISYIKLETIDSLPIGTINKVILEDSLILIHDDLERIWIYTSNGKFISVISKKGDKIDEYNNSSGFTFDNLGRKIIISDFGNKKILFYSINGKFLDKLNLQETSFISILKENNNLFGYSLIPFNISFHNSCLVKFDKSGKILNTWLNRPLKKLNLDGLVSVSFHQLYNYLGRTSLWEYCYDTIYRVIDKDLIPLYAFNYTDRLPLKYRYSKEFKQNTSKFSQITNLFETTNFIFFEMLTSKKRKTFIYDKNTNNVVSPSINRLVNDFDGGIPFWPDGRINDTLLYMIVHPKEIQNYWNLSKDIVNMSNNRSPALVSSVLESNILNNPLILIAHLKNDYLNE